MTEQIDKQEIENDSESLVEEQSKISQTAQIFLLDFLKEENENLEKEKENLEKQLIFEQQTKKFLLSKVSLLEKELEISKKYISTNLRRVNGGPLPKLRRTDEIL